MDALLQYQGKTDEELTAMVRSGSEDAEEELIRRWKDSVRAKAYMYFMKGADKDDIVQEGMIGIFKAIRDYDPQKGTSFRTFANLCIDRQIMSAVKVADRKKHLPLNNFISLSGSADRADGEPALEETLPGSEFDPETLYLIKEAVGYLKGGSGGHFSELELQVWKLYMQGKTYSEIGEALGKSPKAVDNAIQRTKKKLEACIEGRI